MINHTNPHSFFRLFHSRWFLAVNLLLIVLIAFAFTREFIHSRDIRLQIVALQKQSDELQADQLALDELKRVVSTESYAEGEARLKLGLKKPGESIVVLKGESTEKKDKQNFGGKIAGKDDLQGISETSSLANSLKWWYYFFDKSHFQTAASR